jgi:hypothetical protein
MTFPLPHGTARTKSMLDTTIKSDGPKLRKQEIEKTVFWLAVEIPRFQLEENIQ